MMFFDFANPYLIYAFFVLLTAFAIHVIFTKQVFVRKHMKTILIVATFLLLWTQYVRYFDVLIFKSKFEIGAHLPFYICRVSAVVLLYYTITQDKRVEGFLFYWGALGLAGIIYPNGPINNIENLTETFYIDHFLLTLIPFFIIVYKGYRPTIKGLFAIVGVMFVMLFAFVPLNALWNSDYFYLANQSIFGELFPDSTVVVFILVHCLAATIFFYWYYRMFKNFDLKVSE